MSQPYHVLPRTDAQADAALQACFQANGQHLLPSVALVTRARLAVDEVITRLGRHTLETLRRLWAELVAGPQTPGRASGEVRWHGTQAGSVRLQDRTVAVTKPRLRRKAAPGQTSEEVPVPADEALPQADAGTQMLNALVHGVSTRQYTAVLPELAATVGVSKSAVSRQAAEASAQQLQTLLERRWDDGDLLVLYLDGMRFGEHHVISAVGVDTSGRKHVLGIQLGATENAAAVRALLVHLRERGLDRTRRYLFVVDRARALRAAMDEVFGTSQAVQRCRAHKLRNVGDHLLQDQQAQVGSLMRAAYRLPPKDGMARLEKLAQQLERHWPNAAANLREGLGETFTINSLGVPPSLHRCLATTNIIEIPQAGVRQRTGRVTR